MATKPNKRDQAYEEGLEALLKVLRRQSSGLSARELADRLKCSKPTVYARLEELASRGFTFETTEKRAGERGPKAVAVVLKAEP